MGRCELRDSLNFVIHLELVREEGEERNEASPIGERLRVRRPVFSSFFLSSRSLFEASKNSNRVRRRRRRRRSSCLYLFLYPICLSQATRCVKLLFTQRTATC